MTISTDVPPVGLAIGHYRLQEDGATLKPVLVGETPQLIGLHVSGCAALANLFAEAVAAAQPSAGSA